MLSDLRKFAMLSALLATPPAPTPDSNIKWRAKDFGASIWPSAYDIMYRILQLSFTTSVAGLARAAGVPYQSFNNFVKAGGAWGGKDNQAYHPAAALVEKVRIALGLPIWSPNRSTWQMIA